MVLSRASSSSRLCASKARTESASSDGWSNQSPRRGPVYAAGARRQKGPAQVLERALEIMPLQVKDRQIPRRRVLEIQAINPDTPPPPKTPQLVPPPPPKPPSPPPQLPR